MNASKQEKKCFVEKISTFELQKKKQTLFKLFEFLEQFMIYTFVITLIQLEKSGSTGKVFFYAWNLKIKNTFETKNRSRFFSRFPRSYVSSAIYAFIRWISIKLKKCIYTQVHSYKH